VLARLAAADAASGVHGGTPLRTAAARPPHSRVKQPRASRSPAAGLDPDLERWVRDLQLTAGHGATASAAAAAATATATSLLDGGGVVSSPLGASHALSEEDKTAFA